MGRKPKQLSTETKTSDQIDWSSGKPLASKNLKIEAGIDIVELKMGLVKFYLLGTTPLIMHRMSEKARQQLLFPDRKKNDAEKQSTLKHDPIAEFHASVYRTRDDSRVTRLHMPAGAFKSAITDAALRIPGATKTAVGQLTSIPEVDIPIYGIPKLIMSVVREGGMTKTPNIRTRAIFERWCAVLPVRYVSTLIKERDVVNLAGAGGIIMGVGDWRPEKGAGSYGQFVCTNEHDKQFAEIMRMGGRKAQDAALASPECYDVESEELLAWFETETQRREMEVPSSAAEGAKGKKRKSPVSDLIAAATAKGKPRGRPRKIPAHEIAAALNGRERRKPTGRYA
jgi:hypothetical protein